MPTFADRLPQLLSLAIALLLATPLVCQAHAVRIFAAPAGDTFEGSAYYPGGEGLAQAPVRVYGPDGKLLAQTVTDAEGRFSVPANSAASYRFVVETPDGHRAEYLVREPAEEVFPPLPEAGKEGHPSSSSSVQATDGDLMERRLEEAVARQLRPLREQLYRHDQRIRLRDILGGLGYILGLAGFSFYWAARKHQPGERKR